MTKTGATQTKGMSRRSFLSGMGAVLIEGSYDMRSRRR